MWKYMTVVAGLTNARIENLAYQYDVKTIDGVRASGTLEQVLHDVGERGWELAGIQTDVTFGQMLFVFKRPVSR